jgi:putative tryptophan/tyrosine transport system substrate-binding protein
MRRRDFIGLVGGAASIPFAARAQQGRVRLIGMLNILGRDDPEARIRLTVFQQALQQLGWEVGRDLKIENRQVGGDIDRPSPLRDRASRTQPRRDCQYW